MKFLTSKQQELYENATLCSICKEKFEDKYIEDKICCKVRYYTGEYRGAAHSKCNLKYTVPTEISVVFHNGSSYDYHFMIQELAEGVEGKFNYLKENTKKYITFPVPIKKKVQKLIKNENKLQKLYLTDTAFY